MEQVDLSVCVFQAQRNNEDVDTIKPLFSVNVDHRVSIGMIIIV